MTVEQLATAIERLVSDYIVDDVEMIVGGFGNRKTISQAQARHMYDILSTLYRVCHVARKPSCLSVHKDWQKELALLISSPDNE